MSSMLKLLAIVALLSSLTYAESTSEKLEDFLTSEFEDNPRLKSVEVKVGDIVPLKDLKGWNAYVVNVQAVLNEKPKDTIHQKMIWFSDGKIITKELTNMINGQNLAELVKPDFKPSYYSKKNLIYGNANAKHKVAIFSDPLCPFCKGFVPGAIKDMKKDPKKFAIYYYHFPLPRLHPAAVVLVQAAAAAEHKGFKNVVLKMYNVKVNAKETNPKIILAAFNKAVGSNVSVADLKNPAVIKQVKFDAEVASNLMVGGTPTLYLDGKIDNTKKKYQKIK